MRFFAPVFAIATFASSLVLASPVATPVNLSTRQEALRFGVVNVSPSTVAVNQPITITYNSTLAAYVPQYVDFYLQGQLSDEPTPYILIARNSYAPGQKTLVLDTTVPDISPFLDGVPPATNWLLWAFITYPDEGLMLYGGTSAAMAISD